MVSEHASQNIIYHTLTHVYLSSNYNDNSAIYKPHAFALTYPTPW